MKTTVITTSGSSVKSSLNLKYITFDFSEMSTDTYTPRMVIKCADYFNKHGKYPSNINIIVFNGTDVTVGSSSTRGLTLLSTEIIGEDTVRRYNFDADTYVNSDYTPVSYVNAMYFRGGVTKVMIEDVGISAVVNFDTATGKYEMDYNYYIHFPKEEAVILQPVSTTVPAVTFAGMFKDNMPCFVYIDVRYANVSMTKEQFLEITRCCSAVNFSTFKFLNGQPTPEEIIANINVNYPTNLGDNSTGVWLGFIHNPYHAISKEDVADLFKERGVRNFHCGLHYSSGSTDVYDIYFDNNGDYTINEI